MNIDEMEGNYLIEIEGVHSYEKLKDINLIGALNKGKLNPSQLAAVTITIDFMMNEKSDENE